MYNNNYITYVKLLCLSTNYAIIQFSEVYWNLVCIVFNMNNEKSNMFSDLSKSAILLKMAKKISFSVNILLDNSKNLLQRNRRTKLSFTYQMN